MRYLLRVLVVSIVAASVGLGLFLLVLIFGVLFPSADYRNRVKAMTDMVAIASIIGEYQSRNAAPPKSLVEGTSGDNIRAPDRFKKGIDPWGTPYFYSIEEVPGKGTIDYNVTVRSFGPNRSDDGGEGDDLQRTYHVLVLLDR